MTKKVTLKLLHSIRKTHNLPNIMQRFDFVLQTKIKHVPRAQHVDAVKCLIGIDQINVSGRMNNNVHAVGKEMVVLFGESELHQCNVTRNHTNSISTNNIKIID